MFTISIKGAPPKEFETAILAQFSDVSGGAKINSNRWMEKFGEWKHSYDAIGWKDGGKASWTVEVLTPGNYQVDLTYKGKGKQGNEKGAQRLVWKLEIEGGQVIQNQQNASDNYQYFPIGWLNFPKAGTYKVSASCI